jgi:hypothetical protein
MPPLTMRLPVHELKTAFRGGYLAEKLDRTMPIIEKQGRSIMRTCLKAILKKGSLKKVFLGDGKVFILFYFRTLNRPEVVIPTSSIFPSFVLSLSN